MDVRYADLTRQAREALTPEVIAATVCVNIVGLAMPLGVLQVYDRVLRSGSRETLAFLALFIATALVLECAFRILRGAVQADAAARYEHDAGRRVFAVTLEGGEAGAQGSAAIERFTDLQRVKDFFYGQSAAAAIDLPFAAIAFMLIIVIAGWLAIIPAVLIAGVLAATMFTARALASEIRRQRDADQRRSDFLFEVIAAIHTVKALAVEPGLMRRQERLQTASAVSVERMALISGASQAITAHAAQSASVVIVLAGAVFALNGHMTIGAIAATSMLAGRMLQPIARATAAWTRYQSVSLAQSRVNAAAAVAVERAPAQRRSTPPNVFLENVSFSFREGAPSALNRATLLLPAGAMIGVTGRTGAGKTTLLRLLAGQIEPDSGRIVVDGDETARLSSVRSAFVSGEGGVFSGTILQNVAMFREGIYEERAVAALRAVGLADYVASLPRGLDTDIGGDGAAPPPGIAQRLLVARGLVDDALFFLINDASQSLDFKADARMLALLKSLRRRKTVVVSTQRPSYLNACDAVYAIENGAIRTLRGFSGTVRGVRREDAA